MQFQNICIITLTNIETAHNINKIYAAQGTVYKIGIIYVANVIVFDRHNE